MAVRVAEIEFTAGETQIVRYDSSDWARRAFCQICGSNLFYELRDGGHIALFVGAVEDAESTGLFLHGEIFIDDKPAFYELAGDHERLTGAEFTARVMGPSAMEPK